MIDTSWGAGVAPGHARAPDGELTIGGVGVRRLAQTYGTPLLAIDLDVLDASTRTFLAAAQPAGIEVAYAAKAFFCVALGRHLAATALRFDVCSLGELVTAERAGIAPERIVFHGCGKTREELAAIAARRAGVTVVDNADELAALAALGSSERPIEIVLRINVGIETLTHSFVRTSGENTKFGFPLAVIDALFARVAGLSGIRCGGLHSHLGSQIDEADAFVANLDVLVDVAARARRAGLPIERLIAGGGFAVEARPDLGTVDVAAIIARIAERAEPVPYRIGIEPGRSLVARAGTSLYEVAAVKQAGDRRYVVVDGGIADNPRPALYGAYHHPLVAFSNAGPATGPVTICGRSCENDRLVEADLPLDLVPGDLVALCTTGAYTYAMASNYNRFGRPAVVFVGGGIARPAIARESVEQTLERDLDA